MGTPLLESRPRRGRRAPSLIGLAVAIVALALAGSARADVGETIILRCTHGESLGGFSQADYRKALKELSADTEEYSDCASRIRHAQEASASGRGSSHLAEAAGRPTPIATSPAEESAIAHAKTTPAGPIPVGGQLVEPGVVHASLTSAFSTLPTPMIVMLAFLLACVLAILVLFVRKHVGTRRAR
jgi:hypothetical protein